MDVHTLSQLWVQLFHQLSPVFGRYREKIGRIAVHTKSDNSLVTDADHEIEDLVIAAIEEFDAGAAVISEEAWSTSPTRIDSSRSRYWTVDPIDGTREFVHPKSTEFCTAVSLVVDGRPLASFVFAPEGGRHGEAVVVTASLLDNHLRVNGTSVAFGESPTAPHAYASMTRSRGTTTRPIETAASAAGLTVKTETTSQTLDLIRTTPAGRALAGPEFRLFYRENQKIWDGMPGMCAALACGLSVTTLHPTDMHLPLTADKLVLRGPAFGSTLVGDPSVLRELQRRLDRQS